MGAFAVGTIWGRVLKSAKGLVLCVDDDPSQLRLMNDVLVKDGFVVLQASRPEDGIEFLRENPVNLIIADHMLRGMSGTELAAKLKEIKPSVPIVLHSKIHPDIMQNVDAFINKSESVEEFLAIIRDLVKRFTT